MTLRDDIERAIRELMPIYEQMAHAEDRIAAISCAAYLDLRLIAAISARLVPMGKDWKDRVFENAIAPLGTMHAKTIIGYALGVFGPRTKADIDIIRSVRNEFAHESKPVSFDDPEIAKNCLKLQMSRVPSSGILGCLTDDATPKQHYIRATQNISSKLMMSVISTATRPKAPEDLP